MQSKLTIIIIVTILEVKLVKTKDGIVRYSSNIVHENKLHPDLSGQSYTNYQFDPTNVIGRKILQTSYNPSRKEQNYFDDEETKLFNVGYTISFSNNQDGNLKNQNGRTDDIIIGTRSNDQMPIRPSSSTVSNPPEEIVLNEFLDGKKRKLSGIKPKYFRPLTHGLNTKHLLAQANLSQKTLLKLAELQISETTTTSPSIPMSSKGSSDWKPLSSGVEIYRSNNIYLPVNNKQYQLSYEGFNRQYRHI